jgi:hypothetical protein
MSLTPLQKKVERAYNKVRRRFFEPGTTIELLASNTLATDFEQLEIFYDAWWAETNNFMKTYDFFIVERDDFKASMRLTTYVRIKPGGRDQDAELYKVERRNVYPPKGADQTWLIRCDQRVGTAGNFSSMRA